MPPFTNLKKFLPKKPINWVQILFVGIVFVASFELMKDLGGSINWNTVLADTPLHFIAQILGTNVTPNVNDLKLISDNYSRCQNKLGINSGFDINGTFKFANQANLVDTFQQAFKDGAKYYFISVESYSSASIPDTALLINLIASNNLIPVLVIGTVGGSNLANVGNITDFYTQLTAKVGNYKFVATTAPQTMMDASQYRDVIVMSESVAQAFASNTKITTAPPIMTVNETKDDVTGMQVAGLDLNNFDTILVGTENSDTKFNNGTSLAKSRAYYYFSHGETSARVWLDTFNNTNKLNMTAIIGDFGAKGGTENQPDHYNFIQRMAYDFGSFSDDQLVAGVIVNQSKMGGGLTDDDLKKINLAGTNCNYDLVDYQDTYRDIATANPTSGGDSSTPQVSARFVCGGQTCAATLYFTRQIGLPIRSFGSNTLAGTDTNKYPSAAALVSVLNHDQNDYSNQYAGILSAGDDKYTIPWLGSAIYNTAEGLKAQNFDPQTLWEATAGTTQALMPWQTRDELKSEILDGRSIWAYVQDSNTKSPVADENTLCSGKNCFSKPDYPSVISNLQSYDPSSTVSTFDQVNQGLVQRVKDDPQNMVYGSEQVIDTQKWKDSAGWFCYQAYKGADDIKITGSLDCQMVEDLKPASIDTSVGPAHTSGNLYTFHNFVTLKGTTVAGKCDNYQDPHYADIYNPATRLVETQLLPGGPILTVDNIKNGSCTASKEVISLYLNYVSGADSYKDSGVILQKNMPATPQYNIAGAYDALAVLYKNVQDVMGQRNQKIIFNEGWGWESDIINKAYAKPNEAGGVGINLASGSGTASSNAKEIADIGYEEAQFLTYGNSEGSDIQGLNALCDVDVIPVVRSCTNGACPFNDLGSPAAGGNAQGEYLANIINKSTCGQVYAVCGHNEPDLEYVGPGKGTMQDEGIWAHTCLDTLSQRSQKAMVTTPIFNASYDAGTSDGGIAGKPSWSQDFLEGYGAAAFEQDKSKFACLAFNAYSFVAPPLDGSIPAPSYPVASMYYTQIMSIPAFSGMKACINETGQFTPDVPEPLKTQYNIATVNDLYRVGGGDIEFVLGFNWTGYNPDKAFSYIVLADKGRQLMQEVHTGNDDLFKIQSPRKNNMLENFNTDTDPAFEIPGEYLGTQKYYLADGNSYDEQTQYYPMLGFVDELSRLYAVLANQSLFPSAQLSLVNDQLHLSTGLAENFALLPSCDEDWVKSLPDGQKVDCLGSTQAVDPLGQFLCSKGYDVGNGACNLICTQQPGNNTGSPSALACNINTSDTTDTINWTSISPTINLYLNTYNNDLNNSKTWVANLGVGEDTKFIASRPERMEVTQKLIDYAKAKGLNPRFVITMWLQQSAGSAANGRGLGCTKFQNGEDAPAIPEGLNKDQMIGVLVGQVDCLMSYQNATSNFNQFLCSLAGEDGSPDCTSFTKQPNLPNNICSIYSQLGQATVTPTTPTNTTSTTRTTLKSLSQVQPNLVALTNSMEKNMCLPKGTLLAMMEREITGTLPSVTGDPFQKVADKNNGYGAWGPGQFTNIAWIGTGYGKVGALGFTGNNGNYKYGTLKCLNALNIPYQGNSDWYENPVEQILNRAYVGYALCGTAAKLKNDSHTAAKETDANSCDRDWTADEVKAAARAYLGDCSQFNRPYCDIYIDTICTLYPGDSPTLCAGRPGADGGSTDDGVVVVGNNTGNLICAPNSNNINNIPQCLDGKIRFINPLGYGKAYTITQPYGGAVEHSGVDLRANVGDPIYAAADGVIVRMAETCTYLPDNPAVSLNCNEGAGNYVALKHIFGSTTVWTIYEHMVRLAPGLAVGQTVKVGDLLGYVGMTGNTTGPHLHFELRKKDCYDGYGDGLPFGQCSMDPVPYIEDANGFTQCSTGGGTLAGDYVCPIQNPAAASIYQYSNGCTPGKSEPCYGSHSALPSIMNAYHQHEQLPTDIRAPNQIVVSPTDGVVTEIRNPRASVAAFGDGICDYIRVGDGISSNNNQVNTRLVQDLNLHESPTQPGIYLNSKGQKIYDSTIDDEGEYKYDGGFVISITDAEGKLWRFVHVKPINGDNFAIKAGDKITKGQVLAQVYNGQLSGEWSAWSVVPYQGSSCFDMANQHLHFAIIDANAAKNEANYYTGNTIDSTPWVKQYCGLN